MICRKLSHNTLFSNGPGALGRMSVSKGRESFRTLEEIEQLVFAFESCTLPREEWNHHAHLTVGLWYLAAHNRKLATNLIRNGIQKYNQARGIVQTKNGGYHETITLFYVYLITKYLSSVKGESLVSLVNGLLERYGDNQAALEYYSEELLMSWKARTTWIEPDLKPLD